MNSEPTTKPAFKSSKSSNTSKAEERKKRLAAALRANLKKRKNQNRARTETGNNHKLTKD